MATVYLSLGSNLGNRELNLRKTIEAVRKNIGKILCESPVYENEAVGFNGNSFLNQVIKIETELAPEILLQKTQAIEKKMGRKEKTISDNGILVYSNRIIDIDILLYGDLKIDTETLTIPHPRMFEREFVMTPLHNLRCKVLISTHDI